MSLNEFATVINCMDGRTQDTNVLPFLQERFNAKNVDNITAPGPVGQWLAEDAENIWQITGTTCLRVSIDKHHSKQLAIVAHHGCAGNPGKDEAQQKAELKTAVQLLKEKFPEFEEVIAVWVGADWQAEEVLID